MTSKEFAKLLGVAQSTISRALNNNPQVSEERRAYIRMKAAEYGFELNSQAQGLRTNRTGTVGILFPRQFRSMNENLMLTHVYDGMQKELIASDYDVMTIYDYDANNKASVFERVIRRRKVDALITLRPGLSDRELGLINDNNFPCVALLLAKSGTKNLYSHLSDSAHGGELAGGYFGNFSEYSMMYVGNSEDADESAVRCDGFRRGLAGCGRELPRTNVLDCEMSFTEAAALARRLAPKLRKTRTAIFVYNDVIALGMVDGLKHAGVGIPEQVQIIGMDDIPLASWISPYLTTLHVPVDAMISGACGTVRALIEGGKAEKSTSVYQPSLIVRGTTLQK